MALVGQENDEDAQVDKVRMLRALEDMGAQNETHKDAAMNEPIHIPLQRSYLCADMQCETVGNDPDRCPICNSQVIGLARVLNRTVHPVAQWLNRSPEREKGRAA